MKKIQILAILMVFSTITFGQVDFGPRVGIGTVFNDIESTSNTIKAGDASYGYSLGAFVRLGGEKFKIMPELLYSTSKSNIKFTNDAGITQEAETKLDRIDVPLNAELYLFKFLNLQGGLVGSYNLNGENKGFINQFNEAKTNYKDFTFGYQFGVGLDLGDKFLVDLRYEGPFSEVAKTENTGGLTFDERQSMVKAMVGINIF